VATDLDLESELRALGRALPVPDVDLCGPVLLVLADEPAPAGRPSRLDDLRRWTVARWRSVVAVLLGGTIAFGVVSPVGAAVGRWFGFGAVVISEQPADQGPAGAAAGSESSAATSEPSGGTAGLTLERAAELVGITAAVPSALGSPSAVEVSADHRRLSLVWTSDDGPIRLDEFGGTLSPYYYKKYYQDVEFVRVGGEDAAWLSRPHELVYVDAQGREHTDSARTAGPTLVWQNAGLTLRLEGVAAKDDALRVAESAG